MNILKFGGAALASGSKILRAAEIIKDYFEKERIVVVVSALSGITDILISIFENYQVKNYSEALEKLNYLYQTHLAVLEELEFGGQEYLLIERRLKQLFGQLLTHLISKKKFKTADYDYFVCFGEKLSSLIMAETLQKLGISARACDSAYILVTNEEFRNAKVLLWETKEQVEMVLMSLIHRRILPIVTGFYGATKKGQIALLGRGGSDYTATVLAYVLNASEVILWKEVDGVFTKDPNEEGKAELFPELSYKEALELAQNGAKVLHPEAIKPVMEKEIVVWVKNILKPDFTGTKIWKGK